MSIIDDNSAHEDGDNTFSAEEQAQFDAMRAADGGAPPPALPDIPDPVGTPPVADGATPAEPDDPDVETIKDAEGKPVNGTDGKPQKRVSFHKYQREEQRRRQLETDLQAERDKNSRIDERLKIINEALTTPEAAAPAAPVEDEDPEPNPETHIFEHNAWLSRQLQKSNQRFEQFQTTAQERDQEVQLATTYQNDAGRFAQTEPNFGAAYVYLIKQRDAELELAGVKDPKLRAQQIVREEKGLVQGALADGQSPAERIFNMAKGRGFTAAAAPTPAVAPAPAVADPGSLAAPPVVTPPAAAAAPAAVSVKEQIDLIKNGQEASASLSNAGGSAPSQLTREMLADMPQEEFDDMIARLPKSKVRELLGG